MLSAESLKQIGIELVKYPADRCHSAIMGALRTAQTEKDWLVPETITSVADHIGITPAQAYEVATFYNMYNLEPIGKYKLTACTNLSYVLCGNMDTGEYLRKKLGIGYSKATPDGKFILVEDECMGACSDAPIMLVNNHSICSSVTEEAIEKKLAELE